MSSANSKSKLPKSIQDLVCMLFDVESMKRAMVEFELDLTKMPLGKLSKKQLEKAYGILNEAQQLVTSASDVKKNKFVDVSNQFYTLIPHDFGRNSPPLLDNAELIKVLFLRFLLKKTNLISSFLNCFRLSWKCSSLSWKLK